MKIIDLILYDLSLSGPVKTVRDSHNTPSLMSASAMFDLRKNISEFTENRTRRK